MPEAAPTLPRPPQSEAARVPRDDGLRLDDDERRSPSGPEAREQDPEPAVGLHEPDSPWSGTLQHLQLVPQGENFELERGTRTRQRSEGQEERTPHRDHGRAASPSPPATATAATRTDFSVVTAGDWEQEVVRLVHVVDVEGAHEDRFRRREVSGHLVPHTGGTRLAEAHAVG
jgi:hypothetical protein